MKNPIHLVLLILCCIAVLTTSVACSSSHPAATAQIFKASPSDTPVPVQAAAPTDTPAPALPPADAPTPDAGQARIAILEALMAMYTRPNRMDGATDLGDGQVHNTVIEFVPPDRKHILSPQDGMEYIVIGEKVYALTSSSGAWAETQIPASTFMGDQSETSLAETVSNAQFVGTDTLDGKVVMLYSYLSTTQSSGVELHSQTELWVGQVDGLPYKMVIDGEVLAASTDPATGESNLQAVKALTTTLIHFDPSLSIAAPIQ
jgi:hypothetical protein